MLFAGNLCACECEASPSPQPSPAGRGSDVFRLLTNLSASTDRRAEIASSSPLRSFQEGSDVSASRQSKRLGLHRTRPKILPLPEGEGRGEGEGRVPIPRQCPRWTLAGYTIRRPAGVSIMTN